ncbi:MAG: hypothetical protein VKI83_03765 [Synechococcaceae cyanobacterium]|nr:hypothetical protein [Synechococcaceae cyanobacterium]
MALRPHPPSPLLPALIGLLAPLALLALQPLPGRGELPPWVYGQEQRQAPVVVDLQVERLNRQGESVTLQARLSRIRRQSVATQLRPGQTLRIVYNVPPQRAPGWAGPSPLPLLQVGERRTAWLQPGPGGSWKPAAGGRSFGPSMEEFREPGR